MTIVAIGELEYRLSLVARSRRFLVDSVYSKLVYMIKVTLGLS